MWPTLARRVWKIAGHRPIHIGYIVLVVISYMYIYINNIELYIYYTVLYIKWNTYYIHKLYPC